MPKQKTAAANVAEMVIPEKIVITLKGKDWPIVLSPRVLILAEKATGMNLLIDLGDALIKPSMEFVCAMVYASLKVAGAPYTFDQIQEMVTFQNLPMLAKAISLAGAKLEAELIEDAKQNPTKAETTEQTDAA